LGFLLILIVATGCKPRQIVRSTPQMDVEREFWVRVLLLDNVTNCYFSTISPFSISGDEADSQTQSTRIRFDRPDVSVAIEISNGRIVVAGQSFVAQKVTIYPNDPHIFNLNGVDYRGTLTIIANPDGRSFDVVNRVPLEPYLAGVVGAEMPDYWELEALKAQAIVARTYCLYIKEHLGRNRSWDLSKTQANQVYRGISAESAQIWNVINETYGRVLVCEYFDGSEGIFPTYYSSICGGHTENSERVFGDSFTPLVGTPCPFCRDVARLSIFFWPMAQFDMETVTVSLLQRYPKLEQLGDITNMTVAQKSDYGKFCRLTKIKLVGSTGKSDFLRAEDLRLAIDPTGSKIKSTICHIIKWDSKWTFSAGRGWGHGVGMCQCGAEGMARKGYTSDEILSYYYPGSKIASIY